MSTDMSFDRDFWGNVQDGKIFVKDFGGSQQIGVTLKIYDALQKEHQELFEIAEGYKQTLIEHGLIKIPPTSEQIIQDQAQQLQESREALTEAFSLLSQYKERLENQGESHVGISVPESGGNDPGEISAGDGERLSDRKPNGRFRPKHGRT
jgi:hypothetical protein